MTGEQRVRDELRKARRVVIKFGTNILLDHGNHPSPVNLKMLVAQIAEIHAQGREVVLVSSGAIAYGMKVLGLTKRPKGLPDLQMAASIGQSYLMSVYSSLFAESKIHIGQVLLTHDDLRNRVRHLNARNTFSSLLKNRVLPIVNENDVVSVDEIRVGDNDVLASLVAMLIGADALVLATTANGFYKTDSGGSQTCVSHIPTVSQEHLAHAVGKANTLSTGGMSTKLQAASNVAKMGGISAIVDGRMEHDIVDVLDGKQVGTVIGEGFSKKPASKRKQWIAFFNRVQGSIIVDDGAKLALLEKQRSLLPVGIVGVKGTFGIGSLVQIEDANGATFAIGLSEYASADIGLIKGRASLDIAALLGTADSDEVIHRDNILTDL